MTDRPSGSIMPAEVAKAEEDMSVANAEDVSTGWVIEPKDSVPEPVCAPVVATSKLDKSDVELSSEAIMVWSPVTATLSILIRHNLAKERPRTGGRRC